MNRLVEVLQHKDIELLKFLYEAGYDFEGRYYVGATIVHLAIFHKCPEALPFFDEIGLDFTQVDANDRNPLHFAASQGDVRSIVYLLENHPELNKPNSSETILPVGIATIHNHVEAVRTFLERTKVDPMLISGSGRNLFQTAASRGSTEVLALLVSHFRVNASEVLLKCRSGLNQELPPYELAKQKKHTKTIEFIEEVVRLQGNYGKLLQFRTRMKFRLTWG